MNGLLLHPITERQLTVFSERPAQAVLIAGPAGSGKRAVATSLAETILRLPQDGLADYAYHLTVTAESKTISIEAIRELERFLRLIVPRQAAFNRVVIIDDAQTMTKEAQNALLKTLEEPPEGTLLILTTSHEQALLPTIRSRLQTITVKRPEATQLEQRFRSQGVSEKVFRQAYAISGGLPGLMTALLEQSDHPLLTATERARQLLSQTAYERLLAVDELAKQRELALDVMFILQQMAHVSLQTATGAAADKWRAVLTASYEAADALSSSAQPKLALTKLMLNL